MRSTSRSEESQLDPMSVTEPEGLQSMQPVRLDTLVRRPQNASDKPEPHRCDLLVRDRNVVVG